jgi:hypothetical protein
MSFWKRFPDRRTRRATAAPVAAALVGLALLTTAAAADAPARAAGTSTIVVNDTGRLHQIEENGSQLIEEGPATGSLPGRARASIVLGTTVTLGFTIYLHGGTISGHGAAKLNPGKGEFASFSGLLSVTHGSGHYAHATGSGGLYGTIDRLNNDATVVQVVGHLHL